MESKPSIFISHSHADWRVAKRLQEMFGNVSGMGLDVARSSQDGAIKTGENWRDWIDDQVLRCDVAIVLLTPGSLRGRWVLWEAGAVAGVQYERLKDQDVADGDPLARRVRVLRFSLDNVELGPFGSTQAPSGLDTAGMVAFVSEILNEFRDRLDQNSYTKGMLSLKETAEAFVAGAKEDLRYTPIHSDEGMIQEWLDRLDDARSRMEDRWIVASKRWINVAFLGAANADAHKNGEAIDFRIHTRIAGAHSRLGDWPGTVEQLELAAKLSPNDVLVLRQLGRAHREAGNYQAVEGVMDVMERLDPDIFLKDREGIALRCGYLSKIENWVAVDELLAEAEPSLVSRDAYLANWRAIASMKVNGPEKSAALFEQLKQLLRQTSKGFWDEANLVNALLALGEVDQAQDVIRKLKLGERSQDEIRSATRFYDEIVSCFGRDLDWRAAAEIHS